MAAHEPLIVFPHVRKTAGTTTREILRRQYTERRAVQQVENYFTRGRRCHDALRAIAASPPSELRVAHGHILVWPDIEWPQGTRFFTILRDPVERTISHYSWLGARSAAKRKMTLEAVLADGKIHDNLQCRVLAGSEEPIGKTTRRTLDAALAALDRLDVVGLTERFDESLVLAKQRLGLRTILYRSSRVNTGRPRGNDIPADLREAAERCNRYDMELYAFAQELFEKIPERGKLGFEIDLAALHAAKDDAGATRAAPPPAEFERDRAWQLLLDTQVRLLRAEFERRRGRATRAPATLDEQVLETELKAVRAKARKLEKQVEGLKASAKSTRQLTLEIERLRAAAGRAQELEQELAQANERLELAQTRKVKLERRLRRLRANGQGEPSESPRPAGRQSR